MSAKFLLALIAFNGLCLSANAAFAATDSQPTSTHQITQLSQTIANLIDVDDRHLVELAINRALLAQKVNESQIPIPHLVTAGVPKLPTQTEKQPNADDKQPKADDKTEMTPTIGLIAIPKDGSNKSTTTDNKKPTVRGRVPIRMPEIGRIIKQQEPSIGQTKTSESENTPNSSTTAKPKTAR